MSVSWSSSGLLRPEQPAPVEHPALLEVEGSRTQPTGHSQWMNRPKNSSMSGSTVSIVSTVAATPIAHTGPRPGSRLEIGERQADQAEDDGDRPKR